MSGAQFAIGTIIRHKMFGYRGVIFDVDPAFSGTDDWYEAMARSRPPKDEPWYHVLPDGQRNTTYVAERNMEADPDAGPVRHALLDTYFDGRTADGYVPRRRAN
jgi:heat shock protein HspQ